MPRHSSTESVMSASAAARLEYRILSGSEREPMPGAYIVGRPKPSRRIEVTVVVRSRRRSAEEEFVPADKMGALLPQERSYLTREALAETYGADPTDVEEVLRFASQHKLQAVSQNLAARTVYLSGTVEDFSRAFRSPLAIYRYSRGIYRGRTGPVQIPVILEGVIEGVFGLDNRPVARPHFRRNWDLGGGWSRAVGVSYSAADVAKLYNFPPDADGAGVSIGIIELGGGFTRSDLGTYFSRLGIAPPKVIPVSVNGGHNRPTGNPNGADGEVMLDIEVAGVVAPEAKIIVYFAPNTAQGFLRAVNRAIHGKVHKPSVISISWGSPESNYTQQALHAFNNAFQAAALIGITVCAASGDGGSSDGVPGRLAHVDFPASSPYVLACGGTRLESSGGSITSESVWNNGPQCGAGGGGISDFFSLPRWQKKAGVPKSVNPGQRVGRGVPDLAGNADENTGYQVRIDGVDAVFGGTSAVAPLLAGLVARLNQKLLKPVGYLNPILYGTVAEAGAFHDVTHGDNDMTGIVGGYKAGAGWDAATGLGSPDGRAILAALTPPAKEPAARESTGETKPAARRTRKR